MLWTVNEARARQLFVQAYDDAINVRAPSGPDQPGTLNCAQVRSEILTSIGEHDPALVGRLALAGAADPACSCAPKDINTGDDPRSAMLTRAASFLMDKDPADAARLLSESLSGGIAAHLPSLITRLKSINPVLGGDLMEAAIDEIRTSETNGLALEIMGQEFLGYPDMTGGRFTIRNYKDIDASLASRLLSASLTAVRRFLDNQQAGKPAAGAEADSSNPRASIEQSAASFFRALSELMPSFDRYDPAGAAEARTLVERLRAWMDPVGRSHMWAFLDNGDTPASLMAEAAVTADQKTRDALYWIAGELADRKESLDQVLEIAQKITDAENRAVMQSNILLRHIFRLYDEKKYEDARPLVGRVPSQEPQVGALYVLALKAARSVDTATAIRFLDEAAALLSRMQGVEAVPRAAMLLRIAKTAVALDPSRGFAGLTASVQLINASTGLPISPNALIRYVGPYSAPDPLSLYSPDLEAFRVLPRSDYFSALKLAQSFHDKALNVTAQLAVISKPVYDSAKRAEMLGPAASGALPVLVVRL